MNFNNHINTICRSAANQLNALIRLRRFLGIEERKALIQSFVLSNFNYCPLVWMLSSVKSLNKIENLQKRALRFMISDYENSYDELLRLSGSCSINVRLKTNLCAEIYKILNDLNPSLMREIFETRKTKRAVRERYKINLEISSVNQASFGTKSLRFYGTKIWNSLPYHIKSAENLLGFKNLIKSWNGSFCSCSTLWTDFNILKIIYKKNMFCLFGNTFRWRSCLVETSQIDLQFKRLFTEKISEQTFICYVLNIVNNGKNLLIYLVIISYFFYYLLYFPVDRTRIFDILSKRQNNKVSFTCQLGLGWIWLAEFVFIYLCIVRIFVTDTK